MRFDQCTETCTTDCGHCKGRPVEALRADNERLARRLAGRFEETEKVRAEVASLRQQLAVCSCGSSPMTYEGPEPDCPVHGAVRAFNEASAEIAALRQQLDEARGERDRLAKSLDDAVDHLADEENARGDVEGQLTAARRSIEGLRERMIAAEADRDRLLVVYRAAEAWADQILALTGGKGEFWQASWVTRESKALLAAVDSYRSAAPAEPTPVDDDRNALCVERWPECYVGGYDPRCCRFPKSCSCWKDELAEAPPVVSAPLISAEDPAIPQPHEDLYGSVTCHGCGQTHQRTDRGDVALHAHPDGGWCGQQASTEPAEAPDGERA